MEQCGLSFSNKDNQIIFQNKKYPSLLKCWKWFSTSSNHNFSHFISCMFDRDYPYASEIYSNLSGDINSFKKLENFLKENNYSRVDNRDEKINLDYIKEYDKKPNILKDAWAEKTHGGISAQHDALMKNPPLFSIRIPYYKALLEHSEKMTIEVKEFVIKQGKKCDNCRYCVQMDKTGKKPLSFITIEYNGNYKMCTYFPGFQYCWEYLDKTIIDNIIEFLKFTNKTLEKL